MAQQKPSPEIAPDPRKPEIKPIVPERTEDAPHPEVSPGRDPAPAKGPSEVPPGKGGHLL